MNDSRDNITLSVNKKQIKIFLIIITIFIALCFIPSEKEVSIPEHEHSTSYNDAISFKYIGFKTNTSCLDNAYDSAMGDRELYNQKASDCKSINTHETIEVVRFSNGKCNQRLDYSINMIVDDCDTFYIKNGKLYERMNLESLGSGKFNQKYTDSIDIRYTSGSTIAVEDYYTVKCHAFGLICSEADWLGDDTGYHTRLRIGTNAKIKKYKSVCDGSREMIDDETCVYSDDTYTTITIKDLLK